MGRHKGAVVPTEAKAFKLPEDLALCADLLYTTRQARLALDKQVDELKSRETALREYLIENLPVSNATGIAGKVARATVVTKDEPQVEDWDKFYAYVHKKKAYYLLQRRISGTAIKEVWENNKVVDGVAHITVKSISLNKVK